MLTNYQISENDFKTFWISLKNTADFPIAAVKSEIAKPGMKGQYSLRVKIVEGLDRLFEGQLFHIADDLQKSVRFISTNLSHGDPDPSKWFMIMHVEPLNCDCDQLKDVFLISFDSIKNK